MPAQWNGLTSEMQTYYKTWAREENEKRSKTLGEDFLQYLENMREESGGTVDKLTRKRARDRQRRAVSVTMGKIINHPIYKAGANLMSYESGLRARLVDVESTIETINARVDKSFAYDDSTVKNPTGVMRPFIPCSLQYGGHCGVVDEDCETISNLTYNLYIRTRNEKSKFPLLLEFKVPSCTTASIVLLGRLVDRGRLTFLAQCKQEGSCITLQGTQPVLPMTSQSYFSDLLRMAIAELIADLHGIDKVFMKQ